VEAEVVEAEVLETEVLETEVLETEVLETDSWKLIRGNNVMVGKLPVPQFYHRDLFGDGCEIHLERDCD
jgi:hypothetical protein